MWLSLFSSGLPQVNNFALPSKKYLSGKFSNKDAKYLFSCAAADSEVTKGDKHELWAKIEGVLPRTPRSLYRLPLVANHTGAFPLHSPPCCIW
jgi:hypothetical protein